MVENIFCIWEFLLVLGTGILIGAGIVCKIALYVMKE